MCPEKIICIPEGVAIEDVQRAIEPLGCRILGIVAEKTVIQELQEIKKPSSLARFLQERKPGLPLIPRPEQFGSVFASLRQLPCQEQEALLVEYYGSLKNFPRAEFVAKALTVINNIDWFKVKGEIDPSALFFHVRDYCVRTKRFPVNVATVIDWAKANEISAWGYPKIKANRTESVGDVLFRIASVQRQGSQMLVADSTARGAVKAAVMEVVKDKVVNHARSIAGKIAPIVSDYVKWTLFEDILKNEYPGGNPLEPLIEIYKLGCWPIGEVTKDDKSTFVIFIPPRD